MDPVLAEAAGDAAFELETDLFAALAKGIMEKGASAAFPFAWASLAAQIGEAVSYTHLPSIPAELRLCRTPFSQG